MMLHRNLPITLPTKLLLAALLLLLIGLQKGYAQEAINLSGFVRDEYKVPVVGAAVTINGVAAVSDGTGHFNVSIPNGSLNNLMVRVSKEGYTGTFSYGFIRGEDENVKTLKIKLVKDSNFHGRVVNGDKGVPMARVEVKLVGDVNTGPVFTDESGEFHFKLGKKATNQTRYLLNGKEIDGSWIDFDARVQSVTITYHTVQTSHIEISVPKGLSNSQVYTAYVVSQSQLAVPNLQVSAGGNSYKTDGTGTFQLPVPIPRNNAFAVAPPAKIMKIERDDAAKLLRILVEMPENKPIQADTASNEELQPLPQSEYGGRMESIALSLEKERIAISVKGMELRKEIAQLAARLTQGNSLSPEERQEVARALVHLEEALRKNNEEYERSKAQTEDVLNDMKSKMKHDLDVATQERDAIKKKSRQQLAFFLLVTLALMGLVLIFLFISDRMRRQKEEMQAVKLELEEKVKEINEKNFRITDQAQELQQLNLAITAKSQKIADSLLYARAMQEAILPSAVALRNRFPQHFLLSRSKDIVSGDFHWMFEAKMPNGNTRTFLAVVDCTGHGLSSGFLTMVAHALLSEIVQVKGIYEPKQILEDLSYGVKATFHQNEMLAQEGMDVCLCTIEKQGKKVMIQFSGAKRPLLHIKKAQKEGLYYKGDLHSIMGGMHGSDLSFSQVEIEAEEGDVICLSTDGFSQQGTQATGKVGVQQLLDVLVAHVNKDMFDQMQALESILELYQVRDAQRDDILVLGVRV